jgi:probable phosphoglycerate mutase
MTTTTVLVIRHGETDHNKGGIYQGRLDVSLNEQGREQAQKLSDWLSNRYSIDKIYSSPLARAFATAEAVASRQECGIDAISDLQEIDVGLWEGLTGDQAQARFPEVWQQLQEDNLYTRRPEGESYWDLYVRVSQCMERLVSDHGQETIALVSHGGCVRVVLAHALSLPANSFSFVSGLTVDNTGLSVLQYQHEAKRWNVRTINSICHLL